MEKNYKRNWLGVCIAVLLILTLVTGYYAFKLKEQYNNLNNNHIQYFENFPTL